jgi:hypothetical protein
MTAATPKLNLSEYILVQKDSMTPQPSVTYVSSKDGDGAKEEKKEKAKDSKLSIHKAFKGYMALLKAQELRSKGRGNTVHRLTLQSSVAKLISENGLKDQLLRQTHYTVRMTRGGVECKSSGAGTLADGFSQDPSTFDEWSSYNALFDEFRVLGGKLHFIPRDRYSKTTTLCYPIVVGYDNDSTSNPVTTLATAWQYPYSKPHTLEDPLVFEWKRPNITPSAYWDDVATPSSSLGIVFVISDVGTLTPSTIYGNYFVEFEVEFRSRR